MGEEVEEKENRHRGGDPSERKRWREKKEPTIQRQTLLQYCSRSRLGDHADDDQTPPWTRARHQLHEGRHHLPPFPQERPGEPRGNDLSAEESEGGNSSRAQAVTPRVSLEVLAERVPGETPEVPESAGPGAACESPGVEQQRGPFRFLITKGELLERV